jgi:hypothetical protein
MKFALMCAGSSVIALITSICGYGWFDKGIISIKGGFVNIICVVFWVILINYIDSKKSPK